MLDQLSVLRLVSGRLDAAGHYCQPSMTRDIDVVVQFDGLVHGPLVIGAGRYLGSGLCRPVFYHGE